MDYGNLNSLLGNLEINNDRTQLNNSNTNSNTNNFVYMEHQAKNQFTDSSINNKPKSRKQVENLSLNRNMEMSQFQNGSFNFESVNPQRLSSINTRNIKSENTNNIYNQNQNYDNSNNEDYQLNRNLQVNNIVPRHINVMDYSQFSENYKSYSNNYFENDNDKDDLNHKLSSRENIPTISSTPSGFSENQ